MNDKFPTRMDSLRPLDVYDVIKRLQGCDAMISIDFADVIDLMVPSRIVAHMGMGTAHGENRAVKAAEAAMRSPALCTTIKDAGGLIVFITASSDMRLGEADEAVNHILKSAGSSETDVIFGININKDLKDELTVTIIATGFEANDRV